ncbi:MAG: ABC transporter substrate-binding protein [Arcobacter sp.]|nr:ABC transporter substrate-binding protein [Arcobacter sp.]
MLKFILGMIIVLMFTYWKFEEKVFNNKEIILGTSLPKSGIMNGLGKSVYAGANAYFNYSNELNLLPKNRQIKLVSMDDKYEPDLTRDNVKKLIKNYNLFSLFGFVGTPTVKNILPILDKIDLPLIAPFTGASFLRNANKENIINFRSSYQEEIDKIVGYLHNKKNIKKFAVFYQNDTYGEEGYISLIKSLKKRGLELQSEGMYKRNTFSISHALNEIKSKRPEAIILVGAYKTNALFIKKAKEDVKYKNVIFCNISFGDANQMIKELNYNTDNLLFSQVVPSYKNDNINTIKEYQDLMKKYYPNEPLGFVSLEAFLAAKSIVMAIKNVSGELTRSKFLEEYKSLPTDIFEGINIKYKNNQLLNNVYLFKYENSNFVKINYE